jgi:DNA-binding XRE family transcriptional regulator
MSTNATNEMRIPQTGEKQPKPARNDGSKGKRKHKKPLLGPEIRQVSTVLIWLRNSKNLNQEYLAALLNIERKTYARMESGRADICLSRLVTLAHFYEVPLSTFFQPESTLEKDKQMLVLLQDIASQLQQGRR